MDEGDFDPYFKWLGIPPSEQPANHYRLLGIPEFTTDPDVIENCAEQRIRYVRSFQIGKRSEFAHRLLNEIAAARACLLDESRRQAYNAQLSSRNTDDSYVPIQADDAETYQSVTAPPVSIIESSPKTETQDLRSLVPAIVPEHRRRSPTVRAWRTFLPLAVLAAGALIAGLALMHRRSTDLTFNHVALVARQAASTVEIDDLIVTDLATGQIVYANDFNKEDYQDLMLWHWADDGLKTWSKSQDMTRIADNRMRLETTPAGSLGMKGFDSESWMVLSKPLPRDFSVEFTVRKLNSTGHFFFFICRDSECTMPVFQTRINGHSLWDAKCLPTNNERAEHPGVGLVVEKNYLKNQRRMTGDIRFRLVKRDNLLELFAQDEVCAEIDVTPTSDVASSVRAALISVNLGSKDE